MQQRTFGHPLCSVTSTALLLLSGCASDGDTEDSASSVSNTTTGSTSSAPSSFNAPSGSMPNSSPPAASSLPPAVTTPLTPSVPNAPASSGPVPANGGQPAVPGTTPEAPASAGGANGGESGTANGGSAAQSSATAGSAGDTAGNGAAGTGVAGNDATGTGGANGGSGGSASGGAAGSGENIGGAPQLPLGPLTVYIAGDSTVSTYNDTASTTDQAGWGQMLHEYFSADVTIENRAIGGRTARRFIDEGYLAEIDADIAAGDYLLVQFGTNDGNQSASYELDGQTIPYYLNPDTDFKTYLLQYLEVANAHQATLVFVTPPPRNSAYCTGGNGTGAHAEAMRELGAEEGVAVADLNAKTVAHLVAICPSPTPEDFFLLRGDGSVDGTHFQENGARIMAGFVADGIAEANLPLAQFLE